jgi:hypothetical protein
MEHAAGAFMLSGSGPPVQLIRQQITGAYLPEIAVESIYDKIGRYN